VDEQQKDKIIDAQSQTISWLNRCVWHPDDRNRIADKIADSLNEIFEISEIDIPTSRFGSAVELSERGIKFLELGLTAEDLASMRAHFASRKPHAILDQGQRYYHPVSDIVAAPRLLEIATSPDVLALVAEYFGTLPIVAGLGVWWLSGDAKTDGDQIQHRDFVDLRFCKLFIYLDDVGPEDGPHEFVVGSHDWQRLKAKITGAGVTDISRVVQALARSFQFDAIGDIEPEIARIVKADVLQITGGAGTAFLEDTFGIHRAAVPAPGRHRLVFQATYSMNIDPTSYREMATLRTRDDWRRRLGTSRLERHAMSPWT
jgi:hypothetical protein